MFISALYAVLFIKPISGVNIFCLLYHMNNVHIRYYFLGTYVMKNSYAHVANSLVIELLVFSEIFLRNNQFLPGIRVYKCLFSICDCIIEVVCVMAVMYLCLLNFT